MMEEKDKPTPVKIVDTEKPVNISTEPDKPINVTTDPNKPINVIIDEEKKETRTVSKDDKQVLTPHTTEEDERVSLGQRKINLIWERTQSRIALISVMSSQLVNAAVIAAMLIKQDVPDPARIAVVTASVAAMNLTVGIIIGFYFSRTNHSAIGGTGKKTSSSNQGTR